MKKIIVFTLLLIPIIATSQDTKDTNYVWTLRLDPKTAQVWINDTLPLNIGAEGKNKMTNEIAFRIYALGWVWADVTPTPPICTVNGIVNGNNEVGQIIVGQNIMNGPYGISFRAPWRKPDKNPVEVKAAYKGINVNGRIFDTTITCHFEIRGGITMRLDPDSAWLGVNDTLPLTIVEENEAIHRYPYPTYHHDTLRGVGWYLNGNTRTAPSWTVNGIPNGNNLVGEIIMNDPTLITFKAPIRIPVKNPVEVIAAYDSIYLNEAWRSKKFTALIWIVDSDTTSENKGGKNDTTEIKGNVGGNRFEVKMVASLKGGSNASWGGVVTYNDAGSFRVMVEGEKAVLTDIQNNLEVLTTNCAMIITNPTTNTGMLHVVGAKSIKVTPPNPPGQPYPIVEIWFVPHPTELTQFKFTCPPPPSAQKSSIGKVDLSQMAMLTMSRMPALPPYIKFIAKDGDQIIMEKGSPGSEIYYKFSVRKVKDD